MRQHLIELLELTKHTSIHLIVVIPTEDGVSFWGMAPDAWLIFEATSKEPIEGLTHPIGLPSLDLLDTVVNATVDDNSVLLCPRDENGHQQIRCEGNYITWLPVLNAAVLPTQPNFAGTTWDSEIDVNEANIIGLSEAFEFADEFHDYVQPVCSGLRLWLDMGGPEAIPRVLVDFADESIGVYTGLFGYALSEVVAVLTNWSDATMWLSNDGVMKVESHTELINATALFPGHN